MYHTNPGQNYYSLNYADELIKRFGQDPTILNQVREQIKSDLDFGHNLGHGFLGLFGDNSLILRVLQVNVCDFCGIQEKKMQWPDIRVSRCYLRKTIQETFVNE